MVHGRKQTYHRTGMCLELGSLGAKAVSFLLSRPPANLISGFEQLPKSAPEELELRREVSFFSGVELGRGDEEV